jgi:hypothetical protein
MVVLAMLGLLLGGCRARTAGLEVCLREAASRRPLAGVTVRVAGADFVDPSTGSAIAPGLAALGEAASGGGVRLRSRFAGVSATTDAFGLAWLEAPLDEPFEVLVLRGGDPVRRLMLGGGEHPAATGRPSAWIEFDGDPEAAAVELQLRPRPY